VCAALSYSCTGDEEELATAFLMVDVAAFGGPFNPNTDLNAHELPAPSASLYELFYQ
jgi:hypothetical protein